MRAGQLRDVARIMSANPHALTRGNERNKAASAAKLLLFVKAIKQPEKLSARVNRRAKAANERLRYVET